MYDPIALVAAVPALAERFFETDDLVVHGVRHRVVGVSADRSGVRPGSGLQEWLCAAFLEGARLEVTARRGACSRLPRAPSEPSRSAPVSGCRRGGRGGAAALGQHGEASLVSRRARRRAARARTHCTYMDIETHTRTHAHARTRAHADADADARARARTRATNTYHPFAAAMNTVLTLGGPPRPCPTLRRGESPCRDVCCSPLLRRRAGRLARRPVPLAGAWRGRAGQRHGA